MGNQVPALSLFDILFLLRTVLTTPPRPKKIELRENNVFLLWGLFVVASSCGINPIRVEYHVCCSYYTHILLVYMVPVRSYKKNFFWPTRNVLRIMIEPFLQNEVQLTAAKDMLSLSRIVIIIEFIDRTNIRSGQGISILIYDRNFHDCERIFWLFQWVNYYHYPWNNF